jgi:hypothetical protein
MAMTLEIMVVMKERGTNRSLPIVDNTEEIEGFLSIEKGHRFPTTLHKLII